MAHLLIGIGIILVIVAAVVFFSRTKPSEGNGDNLDAARRWGGGPFGGA